MSKRIKHIKLEDLAKKLKVSAVTVSKALRDHPDISPETTERVKELADKMGYMPNFMAKNLSSRKSNAIGLVVPKIAHLFFASVIESVFDTAFEHNYETLLTVSQEQADRERKHILSLLSMRVDGLIISITQETRDLSIFEKVQQLKVPIIFIDRVPEMKNISTVTVDDKGGAFSAVDYAVKKGYKKIAHIGGYTHINIGRARQAGFMEALRHNKIPVNKKWILEGGFGEQDGYNGFRKILETGEIPEYVLAVTYPVALGIRTAAMEANIRIPEDLEVTCFGNNLLNRFSHSIFNFVNQPAQDLGRQAVNMLLKKIENPKEETEEHIELKTRLLISGKEFNQVMVA